MLYCGHSVGTGGCFTSLAPIRISNEQTTINRISDLFPDPEPHMIRAKLNSSADIQTVLESSLEAQSRATVEAILEAISHLSPLEKLLLYIKLPTGKTLQDPLKQPKNPLGSRREISLTVSWIKTHLQEDSKTSLPKQDVYNEYMEYCHINEMKALSTADFGKVMKQVYPNMRPRRLGTRGNSRYCYSGLSSRASLPTPTLPILPSLDGTIVCRWAAKILGKDETFSSIANLEHHLLDNNLLPKKTLPSHFDSSNTNDKAYMMSSKICRPDKKLDDRRKSLGESPSTSKGAPERCKGKRSNSTSSTASITAVKKEPLKRLAIPSLPNTPVQSTLAAPVTSTVTPTEEVLTNSGVNLSKTTSPITKLPIPRLPKIISNKSFSCSTNLPVVKRHKPIVPKDLIGDSNNSFEQEEELLNYFRRQGDDETKTSTLRMLLEQSKEHSSRGSIVSGGSKGAPPTSVSAGPSGSRSTSRASSVGVGTSTARRRVSFDPPPTSDTAQKKFSFVPISPISPDSPQFVTPQTPSSLPSPHMRPASVADPPFSSCRLVTSIASSSSSDAPLLHGILNNSQLYSAGWRSQSVPACLLPQITPVPSEPADFDMTESDSSNLLESDSLGGDNLGQILSYITELESPSVAETGGVTDISFKEEQPDSQSSFTETYPQISALLEASTDLFEDSLSLDCDDAFESLAQSVCSHPKGF